MSCAENHHRLTDSCGGGCEVASAGGHRGARHSRGGIITGNGLKGQRLIGKNCIQIFTAPRNQVQGEGLG